MSFKIGAVKKFIKKRLKRGYFPVKLARFSRTFYLQNISGGNSNNLFKDVLGYAQQISYHLQLSQ